TNVFAAHVRSRLEAQTRAEKPFVRRTLHVPIADGIVGCGTLSTHALPIERCHRDHVIPGFAAEGACVHGKRTAQRPRNAGEELCGPEAPFDALLRELCACDAAAAVNLLVAETLELGEDAVRIDHGAANPAVAHEQVAAEADPKNGRIGI